MDPSDIFISYSHQDGAQMASELNALLSRRGFRVFMDQVILRTGDDLERSIFPRIRAAVLYVPIITRGFCDPKRWAFKEYELALAESRQRTDTGRQAKFLFPILHEISDPRDASLDNNLLLREHLLATKYRRSSESLSEIVDEIVSIAGVNEDFFSEHCVAGVFPARFPVTNIEYRRFIEAGGYTNEGLDRWWSTDGRQFWFSYAARIRHKYLWSVRTEDQVIDENLTGSNARYNSFNQPVTGVCYFEAEAYCRWASTELGAPLGFVVRLPTEREWLTLLSENPARPPAGFGDFQPDSNNLLFHRSRELSRGELDLSIAAKVSFPSTFGAYSNAPSHSGCHDLIGNVWEWAGDFEDPILAKEKTGRCGNVGKILGNCCFDIPARISFPPRELRFPGYRHHVIGFRVVMAMVTNQNVA
ncbi:MAG: SUMF1/EgtB/PvdO family nonheme iron enzyme [Nitrospira sp.]|nr:SUMF1/EgtB/PvdO family nonheme iron enzyme [Nitrospira sp.]